MLGLIGGTSLLFSRLPELDPKMIPTPYGRVEVLCGEIALLMRHQHGLPPHRINHRANIAALAVLGVDRIVAFGSAGSLRPEIRPGSLLIPTDYVSLTAIPTVHDHRIVHVCPEISAELSRSLACVVGDAKYGGIYVQTPGPRIETVAEVVALAQIADVVGMTVASEATLSRELSIPFAALCTVDNYAHGLSEDVPTYEHILDASRKYRDRTGEIVGRIIDRMG